MRGFFRRYNPGAGGYDEGHQGDRGYPEGVPLLRPGQPLLLQESGDHQELSGREVLHHHHGE